MRSVYTATIALALVALVAAQNVQPPPPMFGNATNGTNTTLAPVTSSTAPTAVPTTAAPNTTAAAPTTTAAGNTTAAPHKKSDGRKVTATDIAIAILAPLGLFALLGAFLVITRPRPQANNLDEETPLQPRGGQ
uniref:Uncharacterized protein n=1 Tax=Neobodo designis TaxID=312471 RepID=A0A7S1LLF8_NEODS|mmetsp:Transcript_23332/g.72275  ORF Transcript_23332/g.72275 Transcript_23332/m.72275 type:complete len:134 (+) Transcript_23332:58-459(+)